MPANFRNGAISAADLALARQVFDEVCNRLQIKRDDGCARERIALQVLRGLESGDSSLPSLIAMVMAQCQRAGIATASASLRRPTIDDARRVAQSRNYSLTAFAPRKCRELPQIVDANLTERASGACIDSSVNDMAQGT